MPSPLKCVHDGCQPSPQPHTQVLLLLGFWQPVIKMIVTVHTVNVRSQTLKIYDHTQSHIYYVHVIAYYCNKRTCPLDHNLTLVIM